MVGDEVSRASEPVRRQPSEHFPLAGNRCRQDHVEGRESIGRDDEKMLSEVVDIEHLSAVDQRKTREVVLISRVSLASIVVWFTTPMRSRSLSGKKPEDERPGKSCSK